MDRRILFSVLVAGTFVLTLAFSSWHEGLWRSDAAPVTHAVASHPSGSPKPAAMPAAMAAPAAATNPPPAVAPSDPAQSEPQSDSAPDVDSGERLARRERGGGRGSRSR
jgi:hypothetical protein